MNEESKIFGGTSPKIDPDVLEFVKREFRKYLEKNHAESMYKMSQPDLESIYIQSKLPTTLYMKIIIDSTHFELATEKTLIELGIPKVIIDAAYIWKSDCRKLEIDRENIELVRKYVSSRIISIAVSDYYLEKKILDDFKEGLVKERNRFRKQCQELSDIFDSCDRFPRWIRFQLKKKSIEKLFDAIYEIGSDLKLIRYCNNGWELTYKVNNNYTRTIYHKCKELY